jgi:hypothetical protein
VLLYNRPYRRWILQHLIDCPPADVNDWDKDGAEFYDHEAEAIAGRSRIVPNQVNRPTDHSSGPRQMSLQTADECVFTLPRSGKFMYCAWNGSKAINALRWSRIVGLRVITWRTKWKLSMYRRSRNVNHTMAITYFLGSAYIGSRGVTIDELVKTSFYDRSNVRPVGQV